MKRPAFSTLLANYYSNKVVTRDDLYAELGWDDLIDNPLYENTCSVRVSLALIKVGIPVKGRIKVKIGPYKGKMIEPGLLKLARMLATKEYFGKPEKFITENAEAGVGNRQGIIAFIKLPGYEGGGHMDLISGSVCGSDCYWDAEEIWFWELT
jgi:Type VI secretion system (T6SS), amidase effector protein 4